MVKVNHPYGFATIDDWIFWTEQQKGLVRGYNYNTREEMTLMTENHPLYDLKVFNSRSQSGMQSYMRFNYAYEKNARLIMSHFGFQF